MHWSVRSAAHHDAHHGALTAHGTVAALCGLVFRPQPDLLTPAPLVLHPPVDPSRCCPHCQATDPTPHRPSTTTWTRTGPRSPGSSRPYDRRESTDTA